MDANAVNGSIGPGSGFTSHSGGEIGYARVTASNSSSLTVGASFPDDLGGLTYAGAWAVSESASSGYSSISGGSDTQTGLNGDETRHYRFGRSRLRPVQFHRRRHLRRHHQPFSDMSIASITTRIAAAVLFACAVYTTPSHAQRRGSKARGNTERRTVGARPAYTPAPRCGLLTLQEMQGGDVTWRDAPEAEHSVRVDPATGGRPGTMDAGTVLAGTQLPAKTGYIRVETGGAEGDHADRDGAEHPAAARRQGGQSALRRRVGCVTEAYHRLHARGGRDAHHDGAARRPCIHCPGRARSVYAG